jgi:hypothetical protein
MTNKKLECIKRMVHLGHFLELVEWLVETKLVKYEDFVTLTREQERSEFVYKSLIDAEQKEDLILLDFEWSLLPLEFIKITCVTETEKKEFVHGRV